VEINDMQPAAINIYSNPVSGYLPGFAMNLEPPDWEGYTDDIDQMGGFLQASFNLVQPRDVLEDFFEYGLDRAVDVQSRSGLIIWEGTVDEMTLTIGRVELRKRLGNMANRIWARGSWGGLSGQRSTPVNDLVSQGRYGAKERVLSASQAISLGQVNQAGNVLLNQIALPKVSASIRGAQAQNAGASLELRCKGWWNKFYWLTYNQTVLTGTAAAYAIVDRIVTACGWFVKTKSIQLNDSACQEKYDSDQWPADIMTNLGKGGDANYRLWLPGMRAGREFYWEPAPASVVSP
jgi:hypothetical protein